METASQQARLRFVRFCLGVCVTVALMPIVGVSQASQAPTMAIGALFLEPAPPNVGNQFAASVGFLGDFTGDGGSEYFMGSPSTVTAPNVIDSVGVISVFSGAPTAPIYQYIGSGTSGQRLGYYAEAIGDLDNDGVSELAVGGGATVGQVFTPTTLAVLSGSGGFLLYTLSITSVADRVARLDDVDGDGFRDFALATAGTSVTVRSGATGAIIASLGGAWTGLVENIGDIDLDGIEDLCVVSVAANVASVVLVGVTATQLSVLNTIVSATPSYGTAVAAAGDVDRDGSADLLISAPSLSNPVEVRSGATGQLIRVLPDPIGTVPTGLVGAAFGQTMRNVGDIDADGFDDIAIVAPYESFGGPGFVGCMHIYSGASLERLFEVPGFTSNGSQGFGLAVAGGGDFNSDGFGDVIVGQQSNFNVTDYMCIYLGSPAFSAAAGAGTVGINAGPPVNVFGVADQGAVAPDYGGLGRTHVATVGSALDLWLARPSGHSATFANQLIFGRLETAATFATYDLGFGLGSLGFEPALVAPSDPSLFILTSSYPLAAALTSVPATATGSGTVIAATPPIPTPLTMLLQGLVEDTSAGAVPLAITNLVRVIVR